MYLFKVSRPSPRKCPANKKVQGLLLPVWSPKKHANLCQSEVCMLKQRALQRLIMSKNTSFISYIKSKVSKWANSSFVSPCLRFFPICIVCDINHKFFLLFHWTSFSFLLISKWLFFSFKSDTHNSTFLQHGVRAYSCLDCWKKKKPFEKKMSIQWNGAVLPWTKTRFSPAPRNSICHGPLKIQTHYFIADIEWCSCQGDLMLMQSLRLLSAVI